MTDTSPTLPIPATGAAALVDTVATGTSQTMMVSRQLGTFLQKVAHLSDEMIVKALEEQTARRQAGEEEGSRLAEILVQMGAVTKEQVLEALGLQFDVPFLKTLRAEECDSELLLHIPINFLKQHRILPLKKVDGVVHVAMAEPAAVAVLDELSRAFDAFAEPVLVMESQLIEVINKIYSQGRLDADLKEGKEDTEEESEEDVDLVDLNDEAPIIRWVNSIIFHAVRAGASDIHLEPREKDLMVRYRIDGVLQEYKRAPRNFINSIIARVKIMAGLNIAEKRLPQDGRIRRKMAGKDIDMRVATAPTGPGERITIRLLDKSSVVLDLADIGFGDDQLKLMLELINRPHGIVLVTGPTGSGKTTTLYAGLSKINTADINIMTVEDPVEYQLEGISQIQVNPKIDLTFASAIRSFLRHDPDVIMVGEIRDQETAGMAVTASLTGHLVFSTIHTNDSAGAVTRLIDMGIEPFLVASSISALLAQRLVRRLCLHCREEYMPSDEELQRVGLNVADFRMGLIKPVKYKQRGASPTPGHLFRAHKEGCEFCNRTGYSGRSAIYELLIIDDVIRELTLRKSDSGAIKKAALAAGMRSLRMDGAFKAIVGITSLEEVMLVTAEETG